MEHKEFLGYNEPEEPPRHIKVRYKMLKTAQPATQPGNYLVSGEVLRASVSLEVPVDLVEKRNGLLAAARARIRSGLLDLCEQFPQMRRSVEWQRVLRPLEGVPDRLEVRLYHSQPKQGPDPTPQQARFHVTVTIQPPPAPKARVPFKPLYPQLGLVGEIRISAGDPKLDDALKKLINEPLKPLKQLDKQVVDMLAR